MKALDVAELLICKSKDNGITLSKLQKLLYYAQGFHLAYYQKKLFDDYIFASPTGVTIHEIEKKYQKYGHDTIPCMKSFDFNLTTPVQRVVHDVCLVFESANAHEMEILIKSESPWLNVRKGKGDYHSGVKMNVQDVYDYFMKEYLE